MASVENIEGYGVYLKNRLSPLLVRGLAEIAERRPKDPIDFLARFLIRHRNMAPNPDETDITSDSGDRVSMAEDIIKGEESMSSSSCDASHVHRECLEKLTHLVDLYDDDDF